MERPSGEEVGFTMKFLGVWMDETLSLGLKCYFQLPSVTSHFYETNNEKKEKRNILSGVGFEPTRPFGGQDACSHCVLGRYLTLSLAP